KNEPFERRPQVELEGLRRQEVHDEVGEEGEADGARKSARRAAPPRTERGEEGRREEQEVPVRRLDGLLPDRRPDVGVAARLEDTLEQAARRRLREEVVPRRDRRLEDDE